MKNVLNYVEHEILTIVIIYYRSFDETEIKEPHRITTPKTVIIKLFLLNKFVLFLFYLIINNLYPVIR